MKRKANPKRVRHRKPPPRAQPDRDDLPLHKQLGITKEAEVASAKRIVAPIRQWWLTTNLDQILDRVSLSQGMRDLGLVSVKVLLAELTNPRCPIEIRRHIAMTMAPKLAVEVRAAIAQQTEEQRQAAPLPAGQRSFDLSDLLRELTQREPPAAIVVNGDGT